MTLFEIGEAIRGLERFLSELGGEITDEEAFEAAIDGYLKEMGEALYEKLDAYAWLITEFQQRGAARMSQSERLKQMAEQDEKNVQRLKARLKLFFETQNITKTETLNFKMWLQTNGGKAPLVVPAAWEAEPAQAPEAFQRRVIQLDKEQIRTALENGEKIEGCSIQEKGKHLRIK